MEGAAGRAVGTDGPSFGLTDMLYAFVKNASEHVVSEAMQSLGGYGYVREYGIEKRLRDIKTLQALLPTPLDDWVGAGLGTGGACETVSARGRGRGV
jgi:hypothetical protein